LQIDIETKPSDTYSPLLALPPELRNHIYYDALIEDEIYVRSNDPSTLQEPSLLRTCCRIRSEASPIYYASNNFCLVVEDFEVDTVLTWLGYRILHGGGEHIARLHIVISFSRCTQVTAYISDKADRWTWLGQDTVRCGIAEDQIAVRLAGDYEDRVRNEVEAQGGDDEDVEFFQGRAQLVVREIEANVQGGSAIRASGQHGLCRRFEGTLGV